MKVDGKEEERSRLKPTEKAGLKLILARGESR
jgi:hypothetical protein